jgi:hypothetical protein
MSRANLDLLAEVGAIIDGIPEEKFNLSVIVQQDERATLTCGTVACVLGWLSLHPKFKAKGVRYSKWAGLCWKGEPSNFEWVGAKLFDITTDQACDLFSAVYSSPYDQRLGISGATQKQYFRHRLQCFLSEKGYPVSRHDL